MKAPIILAVDTSDFEIAISWIKATEDSVSVYKLGLEFYLRTSLQHLLDLFLYMLMLLGL